MLLKIIYHCPFRCALLRVSWVEAICVLPWIRGKGLILELEGIDIQVVQNREVGSGKMCLSVFKSMNTRIP